MKCVIIDDINTPLSSALAMKVLHWAWINCLSFQLNVQLYFITLE